VIFDSITVLDMKSYTSPKTKKGLKSDIHGKGIFATEPIEKGEVIAIKNGKKITRKDLVKSGISGHAELQIGDDLYIAPSTKVEVEDSMIFINHSCEPNVGMKDEVTFVAMRNIEPQEELVIDYAMIDDNDLIMNCICNSANCRKVITGKDWTKKDLQDRYRNFFSPYIQSKI
jgi:uncharacterized protein